MKFTQIKFSKEASEHLHKMKGKIGVGLTPNILCRLGFSLSLTDPTIPNPDDYPSDGDRVIDRQVLTGQWDDLYVALLKERCLQDSIDIDKDLLPHFKAHMNRGVLLLSKRVKNIKDIAQLLPE